VTKRTGELLILKAFWFRDQSVGFVQVDGEVLVAHLAQFHADPAFDAHLWRAEVGAGMDLYQHRLGTGLDRDRDGDMAVAVVVIDEHAIDLLFDKESGLAVGQLLGGARNRAAGIRRRTAS